MAAETLEISMQADRVRSDLERMEWKFERGHFPAGALTDPAFVLDVLGVRDSEGNSELEFLLSFYQPEVLATGLFRFCNHVHLYATMPQCRAAVEARRKDIEQRGRAMKGEHDVFCTRCHRSTFSDYHAYVCGEEDATSVDDLISYAQQSDDPDQFIPW